MSWLVVGSNCLSSSGRQNYVEENCELPLGLIPVLTFGGCYGSALDTYGHQEGIYLFVTMSSRQAIQFEADLAVVNRHC